MNARPKSRSAAALLFSVALPAFLFAAAPAAQPGPPSRFSIRWVPDAVTTSRIAVEVHGLDAASLQSLRTPDRTPAKWQRLLTVHAEQGDLLADIGLPAMLGAYRVTTQAVRFEPRFALAPGVRYRAVFYPGQLPDAPEGGRPVSSVFELPPRRTTPSTVVSRVHPSADVLPENLLKFYVHFSAPMSGGHIYEHIHLRNEAGQAIELPFLEIDEELWNPEMTRLTLFIDPGRIKRGVRPLEEIGPALEEGKRYTLDLDAAWRDADGVPLKEAFHKKFTVGPPARDPLDPARWKISPPAAGSRAPLTVAFPAPLDHALALRLIRVARKNGETVPGAAALEDQERRWSFTPAHPWLRGPHELVVQTTIEDLAGNNIGKSFEVDLFESVQRRITNSAVRIPVEFR